MNASGQLAHPDRNTNRYIPMLVPISDVELIAAGGDHSCGLIEKNQLYCWGRNFTGQLGSAPGSPRVYPVPVEW